MNEIELKTNEELIRIYKILEEKANNEHENINIAHLVTDNFWDLLYYDL